jgi:hypothetical protein
MIVSRASETKRSEVFMCKFENRCVPAKEEKRAGINRRSGAGSKHKSPQQRRTVPMQSSPILYIPLDQRRRFSIS